MFMLVMFHGQHERKAWRTTTRRLASGKYGWNSKL
jgi:hypothetical protein